MIESFKDIIIKLESFENQNELFNENITEFINQLYEYISAMKFILA